MIALESLEEALNKEYDETIDEMDCERYEMKHEIDVLENYQSEMKYDDIRELVEMIKERLAHYENLVLKAEDIKNMIV